MYSEIYPFIPAPEMYIPNILIYIVTGKEEDFYQDLASTQPRALHNQTT